MPKSTPNLSSRAKRNKSSEVSSVGDESSSEDVSRREGGVGTFFQTMVNPFKETYSQVSGQFDVAKEPMMRKFRHYNEQPPQFYTHAFSHKSEEWAPVSYQTLNRKFNGHQFSNFRVLTYNIWFLEDENFDGT